MKRTGLLLFFLFTIILSSAAQRKGDQKLITEDEIQTLGAQWYQEYLGAHTVLDSATDKDASMVHEVAARVFNAARNYYGTIKKSAELKALAWQVNVVSKKDVNAFCLPGVRFIIGTGMLDWAQNEGSLAVVLAHELAHTLQKRGELRLRDALREKMGGKKMSELLASNRATDARDVYMAAFGAGNIVGLLPPYSLEDEIEADRLAMIFTGLAGFNPRESIVFWERMDRLNHGPRQPILMSAHPVVEGRVAAMQQIVDEMVRTYYKPPAKS
jgi:predicted Zn-dependent protease